MRNKTANILNIIAWLIWILGTLGGFIVYNNLNDMFAESMFSTISVSILVVTLFNTFCTGMTFYGLATIIEMIDTKSITTSQVSPIKQENLVGTSTSDDVLKF